MILETWLKILTNVCNFASPKTIQTLQNIFQFFRQTVKFVMHLLHVLGRTNSKITMFVHFQEYHRNRERN